MHFQTCVFLFALQSLAEEMSKKAQDKEKLAALLADLTSRLPEGSEERDDLQDQLSSFNKKWSDLSHQLSQCQSSLDTALELASVHDGDMDKLTPWVPQTLEHLENSGPPPTKPEKVEELKTKIEVSREGEF